MRKPDYNSARFRRRIGADPGFFCQVLWHEMGYDRFAPIGDAELEMITWMIGGASIPRHRGVLAPRSIGKTHLAAAVATFRLMLAPETKVLIVSKSESEAKGTAELIRGWLRACPFLHFLQPKRKIGHRDARLYFDVGPCRPGQRTPSVTVCGIDGQLEGRRASFCIADDVETDRNTMTVESRTLLDERVKELARITSYDPRNIVYIGTFHHDESVYAKLNERGYIMRTWPILYPTAEEIQSENGETQILNLAPDLIKRNQEGKIEPGDLVFPHRHDTAYIKECRKEGLTGFYMHYMLALALSESARYPLRLKDLITVEHIDKFTAPMSISWGLQINCSSTRPTRSTRLADISSIGFGDDGFHAPTFTSDERVPYQGTKMWIDPSGRGADSTGYACVGFINGFLWAKAVGDLPGGYDPATLEQLAIIAYESRVDDVYIEDNFGHGMMQPLLEPVLRKLFVKPGDKKVEGAVSGPMASNDQRKHQVDRKTDVGWGCHIQTIRTSGMKETRILSGLEPIIQSHRLIIDRNLAQQVEFQRQITRISNQKGALERDDMIESLAECCRMWSHEIQADPKDLETQQRQRWIDDQIQEMQNIAGVVAGSDPVWFNHY